MVVVSCPTPGCDFRTEDLPPEVVVAVLNIHALEHSRPATAASRGPKLTRPIIDIGVDQETWMAFERRWNTFRIGSQISEDAAPTQLFQCATEALGDLLLRSDPGLTSRPVQDVLLTMRSMAVIPVARGVIRAELMQLTQSNDEPIRTFAARVRGKAETCGFTTAAKCRCGLTMAADYTEEAIQDVLLAGICDMDIRREALSMPEIHNKSVNDIISLIEGREMARNATPVSSLSALSTYKRDKSTQQSKADMCTPTSKTVPCPDCGKPFLRHRERPGGGHNKLPYKQCLDCYRAKRQHRSQKGNYTEIKTIETVQESDQTHISQISALETKVLGHPKTNFSIEFNNCDKPHNCVLVEGIADTGAQSNLWGLQDFKNAGFSVTDLSPSTLKVRAANTGPINVIGQFNGQFRGRSPLGDEIKCNGIVLISDSVRGFYLSYDTMMDLLIIDKQFPSIGICKDNLNTHCNMNDELPMNVSVSIRALSSGCGHPHDDLPSCDCPQRTAPPVKPKSLPFAPTPENNGKMREWLLNQYASSTFNTCPHRPLPCMSGPPIEIHIDELATPRTCHTPAPVPLHWQQRVYEDLLRDEALGVIERVPYGVPVTWCHRMVVTRKHDGTPRRTVDLSPLNKFCKRETYPAESPFHLARRVPGKTWKTVSDAWNGYHSVALRESDKHLTTFITPFGRWRYTRAPQGFLSSGDGYNRRFNAILADFERKERCVDDTIHYDEDLETHWWRTIDLLSMTGSAGAVLNPEKFQFAQRNVDFAGFQISETCIQPLPKYVDAIR